MDASLSPRKISAIILAAGASTRMGTPKATLDYRGETFVNRLIRIFSAYCDEVIVVTNGALAVNDARMVVNPSPERGMLSSLQCGLTAVADHASAVLFMPVDLPAVEESTVARVVGGWGGELVRIPSHDGRRGHPVLISRSLVPEFLELPLTAAARDVIRRHADEIRYVEVNDPGILRDVDTPADYARLA